jgi:hypothetical protein
MNKLPGTSSRAFFGPNYGKKPQPVIEQVTPPTPIPVSDTNPDRKAITNREVYMEDVNNMILAVYDAMDKSNINFVNVNEDNTFCDNLQAFLEKQFQWPDYRHHN